MPERQPMRVGTWNIHGCVGMDRLLDPHRISDVIGELDVEMIGIQEVDTRYRRDIDQFDFLQRATGMDAIAGPTLRSDKGYYGNMLLTRLPPVDVRRFDLSYRAREPRGALAIEVDWHGTRVCFVVTHFGTGIRERTHQVARLAEELERIDTPVLILVGDFNEWRPFGATMRRIDRLLGRSRGVRSFPARHPLFKLDRIWVRPGGCLSELAAHRSVLARIASDHRPVTAAIVPQSRLGAARERTTRSIVGGARWNREDVGR